MTFHRRPALVVEPSLPEPGRSTPVHAWQRAARRALRGCEAALVADRCNAALHRLHAGLLQALGELQGARQALRRALFLDADFLPSHVAHARRLLDRKRGTAHES